MRLVLLAFLFSSIFATAQTNIVTPKPARPFPSVEHVVIISIDGMRPDRMLFANMPALRSVLAKSAYTFWARTTAVAVTLPSHVSMLTGVTPQKHGISWNSDDLPFLETIYPSKPTIMEMARRAGYSTALVAGKTKFSTLAKPGTIQFLSLPAKDGLGNQIVTGAAEKVILENKPDLMFIHFADVDATGHRYGWASPEQLAAIERTDHNLQQVFTALVTAGIAERTVVIITADHGGAGKTHGPDDPRSRHIPWIISGPQVKSGDLTRDADLVINTEDTCATACYLLGLSQLPYFDGKPVLAAFENPPAP